MLANGEDSIYSTLMRFRRRLAKRQVQRGRAVPKAFTKRASAVLGLARMSNGSVVSQGLDDTDHDSRSRNSDQQPCASNTGHSMVTVPSGLGSVKRIRSASRC